MIRFKDKDKVNYHITKNELSNREVNLKIHEMLLNFYKTRDITYMSDLYKSITKDGYYKNIFDYIKSTIDK